MQASLERGLSDTGRRVLGDSGPHPDNCPAAWNVSTGSNASALLAVTALSTRVTRCGDVARSTCGEVDDGVVDVPRLTETTRRLTVDAKYALATSCGIDVCLSAVDCESVAQLRFISCVRVVDVSLSNVVGLVSVETSLVVTADCPTPTSTRSAVVDVCAQFTLHQTASSSSIVFIFEILQTQ